MEIHHDLIGEVAGFAGFDYILRITSSLRHSVSPSPTSLSH